MLMWEVREEKKKKGFLMGWNEREEKGKEEKNLDAWVGNGFTTMYSQWVGSTTLAKSWLKKMSYVIEFLN